MNTGASHAADSDIELLYNTYYMQVYSFVMAQAKSRDLSEELTQKTFLRAMTTAKPFEGRAGKAHNTAANASASAAQASGQAPERASELTWLCAIAKNLLTDEWRRQARIQPSAAEEAADGNVEQALVDEDSAFRVHQALHGLEEPYKEVFQLRVFGELPFRKIGLLFGKTENWARVTYHRARLRIQERMGEQ